MIINPNNIGNYKVPESLRNSICVDIGANVGNFFKKYKDFFSLIHFYEPFKDCYDICVREKFNNVIGFNQAVSDKCEYVNIIKHSNNECGSNAISKAPINSDWLNNMPIQNNIESIDLETVLYRIGGKIDYLKCDAETSEYLILLNKDLSNIKFIGIELHHQMGEEKYNKLIEHILKTHKTYDDYSYSYGHNKECLFF